MLSHNSINDVPAHANAELMGLIRKWGRKAAARARAHAVDGGGGGGDGVEADADVPIMMASDMCDIGRLAYPAQISGKKIPNGNANTSDRTMMKDSFAFAFSSVSGSFLSFFWHAYDVCATELLTLNEHFDTSARAAKNKDRLVLPKTSYRRVRYP